MMRKLQTVFPFSRDSRIQDRISTVFLGMIFGSLLLATVSCTRSVNPDIERGSGYDFRFGFPEIRASAIGLITENGQPQIQISTDIVYSSLIYRTVNNRTFANVLIEIEILGADEGSTYSNRVQHALEIESVDQTIITTQDAFTFQRGLHVDPGNYSITINVLDQSSGKATASEQTAFIPDPDEPVLNLTTIRLLGRSPIAQGGFEFLPVSTYDVPGRVDSLRFLLQVTNNLEESPLEIKSRLLRFVSDDSPARPMHFNNYGASTLAYKGIEYDRSETITESVRELFTPGSVTIEYPIGRLLEGNYRFEVRAIREGMEEEIFKARDFSVKSRHYPAIQSARELAAPLYYLMDEKAYEALMSIQDEDSLKQAVDRFWLSNVQSMSEARAVIEKYYQRVEEANKQFSNFKEGWKTDIGMVYILFGPPWYVERKLNMMLWSYAYDRSDPRYNFFFEQPKVKNEFFPFNNYLLERNQGYYNIYYQQVQLWLTGQIIRRDL